jgi:hypothetical protein
LVQRGIEKLEGFMTKTLKEEAKKAYKEYMADYNLPSEYFLKLCDKYGWHIMDEVVTEYRREHPELGPNDDEGARVAIGTGVGTVI